MGTSGTNPANSTQRDRRKSCLTKASPSSPALAVTNGPPSRSVTDGATGNATVPSAQQSVTSVRTSPIHNLSRPSSLDFALQHNGLDVGELRDIGKDLCPALVCRGTVERSNAVPMQNGLDDIRAFRVYIYIKPRLAMRPRFACEPCIVASPSVRNNMYVFLPAVAQCVTDLRQRPAVTHEAADNTDAGRAMAYAQ
jgi:hypothetical protein